MDMLAVGIARASRGTPLGVAMIHVDRFKPVNDGKGHLAGDRVLAEIAARIRASVREFDTVGRYGGDEFVVVLGDCSREMAYDVCERVRSRVAAKQISTGESIVNATVSIGLALYAPTRTTARALLAAADEAPHAAKRSGRNPVSLQTQILNNSTHCSRI